uniref:F-box domain-containing protein n=1 Tax=Steinernema glaseri TaxID=37863 RepID=A0A1I7ZKC4_9BILA
METVEITCSYPNLTNLDQVLFDLPEGIRSALLCCLPTTPTSLEESNSLGKDSSSSWKLRRTLAETRINHHSAAFNMQMRLIVSDARVIQRSLAGDTPRGNSATPWSMAVALCFLCFDVRGEVLLDYSFMLESGGGFQSACTQTSAIPYLLMS